MSGGLDRASVLLAQGRPELAEGELRLALAESPHDPVAHACLSLCLSELDREREATREAREAVRLAPDFSLAHHALAVALERRNHFDEALAAVEEAIRLDPHDPDGFALIGRIHIQQRRWSDALAVARRGLDIDPEHVGCTNVSAIALTSLGREEDADEALGGALARDPEDALTHANTGWVCLHRGNVEKATEHFREALRLEPDLEWARAGLLQALKAANRFYRLMLRFFVWMGTLTEGRVWVVIIGIWVVARVLKTAAVYRPDLEPWLLPPLFGLAGFVYLTWTAEHISNVALFVHPVGRNVLSRRERLGAAAVTLLLVSALGMLAVGALRDSEAILVTGLMALVYVIPFSVAWRVPSGKFRWIMLSICALLAVIAAVAVSSLIFAAPGTVLEALAGDATMAYFVGSFVAILLVNVLSFRGVRD